MKSDEGSVSVELAILAPLIALLLVCVVAVGRVQNSRADVEAAAQSAARDISIARDPAAAFGRVRKSTAAMLHVGSPSCREFTFTPSLTADDVTVSVACVADLQDAAVLPLPGSMTLRASATEVLDQFRETS
jgi:Flp pilus assembly protein TadG